MVDGRQDGSLLETRKIFKKKKEETRRRLNKRRIQPQGLKVCIDHRAGRRGMGGDWLSLVGIGQWWPVGGSRGEDFVT